MKKGSQLSGTALNVKEKQETGLILYENRYTRHIHSSKLSCLDRIWITKSRRVFHNTSMEREGNKFSKEMQISYEICLSAYILEKKTAEK